MTTDRINVCFFGDSICFGQGISIHKGWVTRISQSISDLCDEFRFNLVFSNHSINGNTTRLALERMPYDIQSNQPDILIVQFGMNDCNYWRTDNGVPRVSPQAFQANLQEIIDRAKIFGVKKIFLNTNHPTTRLQKFDYCKVSYQQSNSQYNKIIRAVAKSNPKLVELNDIEQLIIDEYGDDPTKHSALIQTDGLHLNELGHDVYFNRIYPKLRAFILAHSQALRGECLV